MRLPDIHALAARAIELYVVNKDPLTKSAGQLLAAVQTLPLNEPQINALTLVQRQLQAYSALFPNSLE